MTTFGMLCPTADFFEDFGRGGKADSKEGEAIQGASVAINSFLRAFLRYGRADRYWFFAAPFFVERTARGVQQEFRHSRLRARIGVRSLFDLVRDFSAYNFTHWLDLSCNFEAPSSLRRRLSNRLFPILVTHHTISYHWLLRSLFIPLLLSESYPFDSVVCTSSAAQKALARLLDYLSRELRSELGLKAEFRGRLDVIPLAVDTDHFHPRTKRAVRRQLHLPQDALILLFCGRLSPVDKADLVPFFGVFRSLLNSNPGKKLLLVVAGTPPGAHVDALSRCVRSMGLGNKVRFLLQPENPALLYSAADIFLSPADSVQESFGLTVVEAMACGIPQVVSDWNGYRDTVADGETGFLVPTRWMPCDGDLCDAAPLCDGHDAFDHLSLAQSVAIDLRAYRDRLQRLIDDDDLRAAMSHRSRQRAVECFSWPVVMRRYQSLWTELGALAASAVRGPRSLASSVHPRYYEVFGHFATRSVDASTRLRITAAGKRPGSALARRDPIAQEWGLLDQRLLREALRLLRKQDLTREALADHLVAISRPRPRHRHFIYRQIMFLLKYGLIETCD